MLASSLPAAWSGSGWGSSSLASKRDPGLRAPPFPGSQRSRYTPQDIGRQPGLSVNGADKSGVHLSQEPLLSLIHDGAAGEAESYTWCLFEGLSKRFVPLLPK